MPHAHAVLDYELQCSSKSGSWSPPSWRTCSSTTTGRCSTGPPGLVDDLQWVAIGLLIVIFLWFRPQGVLPERRRMIGAGASSQPMNIPNEDVVALDGVRAGARAG